MALKKHIKQTRKFKNNEQPAEAEKPQEMFLAPAGAVRYISYLISLNPVLGFIIGMIFSSQPYEGAKKFGKNCYVMAAAGMIILIIIFFIALIIGSAGPENTAGFTESYY